MSTQFWQFGRKTGLFQQPRDLSPIRLEAHWLSLNLSLAGFLLHLIAVALIVGGIANGTQSFPTRVIVARCPHPRDFPSGNVSRVGVE